MISVYGLVLLLVSLLLCSMGFKKFVWFLSVGYGLSAAGIGVTLLVMALVRGGYSVLFLLQCLLFAAYGIRLGGFLLIRELKNEKYRAKLQEAGGETKMPFFVLFVMWLLCGALYLAQAAGAEYRFLNEVKSCDFCLCAGFLISLAGVILEAEADRQKSASKAKNSELPAMDGLFRLCRCPNYFGEILFWTGVFLSGLPTYRGAGQWIVAIVGYVAIVGIMFSGAKRLETRHIRHYGSLESYNAYADKTPLLIPFVPLYHLTSPEKITEEDAKKATKAAAKHK